MESRIKVFDETKNNFQNLKLTDNSDIDLDAPLLPVRIFACDTSHPDSHPLQCNHNGHLKTEITSVDTTDELPTTDTTTHTKLDTLETTLTNIETNTPKTLRQYRAEGKCRIASVDLGSTSAFEFFYLNNLSGSGKIYYVYDIQISCQFVNSSTDRVACLMSFIDGYNSGGTASPIRNLKIQSPYTDLSDGSISSYGSSGITRTGDKYYAEYIEMNAGGSSIYLNYQEEFIELNPGTGLQLEVIDNNDPVYLSMTIRWIEEDA